MKLIGIRPLFLLLFFLIAGAVLRIYNIDRMSMWGDEACMLYLCSESPATIIDALASPNRPDVDVAPPFYFLVLHCWIKYFGTHLASLRLLSAVFGIALIPVVYGMAKIACGIRCAILASAFTAFHPFQIWYSQEIRMYTMGAFLCGLLVFFFLRIQENQRSGIDYIGFSITGALCIYTQYYSFLLLGALFLSFIDTAVHTRSEERSAFVVKGMVAFSVIGILFLKWLPVMFLDYSHAGTGGFPDFFSPIKTPLFLFVKMVLFGNENFFLEHWWLIPIPTAIAAGAVLMVFRNIKSIKIRTLMIAVVFPFSVVFIGQLAGMTLYKSHPFILFHSAFICLVSLGITLFKKPLLVSSISILIVAYLFVLANAVLGGEYVKPEVEKVANWIADQYQSGDVVAVLPAFIPNPLPVAGDLLAFRYHSRDRFQSIYLTGKDADEVFENIKKNSLETQRVFFVYQDNNQVRPIAQDIKSNLLSHRNRLQFKKFPSKMRGFSMQVELLDKHME